jgi:hypothetical protein
VRSKIDGTSNDEKIEKAQRKTDFFNQQLTGPVKQYRPELERLLTQLPVGGSQYMKIYWNAGKKSPNVEFVPIDDLILPMEARNFYDLQRKFHRMRISKFEFDRRIESGMYIDIDAPPGYAASIERTKSQQEIDKIEGKRDDQIQDSDERIVYEGCVYDSLSSDKLIGGDGKGDSKAVPYIITIDDDTRKILSVYRNWDEDDDCCEELDYIVDFNFIPWRGVYGLSLYQCLAGVPDALTGALRALMDSALIANLQGGLKLKGNPSGESLSVSPTEITEVDSMGQDDVRKIYMPIPFNQPSPMLFQLLGFLTQAGKGVVGTAEEKIADAGNNMAVGTALALIEQGAKVFSSIHARLHDSQRRCLEILHRLYRDHLPEGETKFGSDQNDYVTPEDFEGKMDVHPVSDPNIFSETQRFAQIQFVMDSVTRTAAVVPGVVSLFDLRDLYARAFELAKIPNYETFLPKIPKAEICNPADENVAMVMGKPVKAYQGQNHEAHIQVHLDFAQNPLFGANPIIQGKFLAAGMNHLMDHLLVWYEEMMKMAASDGKPKLVDWDNDPDGAIEMAKATKVVDAAAQVAFGKIPAMIAQGIAQLKAQMGQPPQDPMVAVEQQRIQGEHQIAQGQLSLAQQKAQADAQGKLGALQAKMHAAQIDYQLAMQKAGLDSQTQLQSASMAADTQIHTAGIAADTQMKAAKLQSQTDLAKTIHDNSSAQHIAEMKIHADAHTHLSDGASLK